MLHLFRHLRSHYVVNMFPASVALQSCSSAIPPSGSVSDAANTSVSSQSATDFNQGSATGSAQSVGQIVRGTVKWFSPRKNIGFIKLSDRDEEVFVHVSDIAKKNPLHTERSLLPGEEVEFGLGNMPNNRQKALNVTGPGGAAVKGVFSPAKWHISTLRFGTRPKMRGNIIARNVQGVVQSFHVANGWGFIKRADTGADVFVTYRGIMGKNPQHIVKSLQEGETVQFHVTEDAKGKQQAIAVTGPNGMPVQGNVEADGPLAIRIKQGEFRREKGHSSWGTINVASNFGKISPT